MRLYVQKVENSEIVIVFMTHVNYVRIQYNRSIRYIYQARTAKRPYSFLYSSNMLRSKFFFHIPIRITIAASDGLRCN